MSSNLKPQDAKALAKEEPSVGDDDLEFSATTTSKLSAAQRKALRGDTDEDEDDVTPVKGAPVQQVVYQQVPPQNVLPLDPADRDARVREEKMKVQMMMKEGEANLKIQRERQLMQLSSLEKQVTEILVSIKQKTQMIEQDLMRIQQAMKSLSQPQAPANPQAPAAPAATAQPVPPKKVG